MKNKYLSFFRVTQNPSSEPEEPSLPSLEAPRLLHQVALFSHLKTTRKTTSNNKRKNGGRYLFYYPGPGRESRPDTWPEIGTG